MQIEESERKIQDLEAENQALKRQLFQEGEQLQHKIEENMPRKEYSLVGTVSMKEKECESEEVPQVLWKPQKGIFILELEPGCAYGQLTIFSKSETRSDNVLFQHVKVFIVISFNSELRQDSMTELVSCPYHWITHKTHLYEAINIVVSNTIYYLLVILLKIHSFKSSVVILPVSQLIINPKLPRLRISC